MKIILTESQLKRLLIKERSAIGVVDYAAGETGPRTSRSGSDSTVHTGGNYGTSYVGTSSDFGGGNDYGKTESNYSDNLGFGNFLDLSGKVKVIAEYIRPRVARLVKNGKGKIPSGYEDSADYAKRIAKALCEKCQAESFNLALAMATAQVESMFGVCGKASHTGQMFNVGQWPGHDAKETTQEKSIDEYISLIKRRYPGWKNIDTFLRKGGYHNDHGKYYCNEDYGAKVRVIYDAIKAQCGI